MKEFVRKIIKNGPNSFYINIPKRIMKELSWKEGRKLSVKRVGEKLIVERHQSQRKLF